MTDVFISYKREDRSRCAAVADALRALQLSVWFDAHIEPGMTFDREIERELKRAKAVVVLWSGQSVESDWVRSEARMARTLNKLVTVKIEPCELPLEFSASQSVELFETADLDENPAWQRILSRIGVLVSRPGLRPFAEATASGSADAWRDWLDHFGEDPLADKARRFISALAPEAHGTPEIAKVPPPAPAEPPPSDRPPADPFAQQPALVVAQNAVEEPATAANDQKLVWPSWLQSRSVGLAVLGVILLACLVAWLASGALTAHGPTPDATIASNFASEAVDSSSAALEATETAGPGAIGASSTATDESISPTVKKDEAAEKCAAGTNCGKTTGTVATAAAPGPCNAGPWIVFFDWDSSSIGPDGAAILEAAAEAYLRDCSGARVRIASHTDRSGSTAYSQAESRRMGESVANFLAAKGIPRSVIELSSFGESRLRVPTADGVREMQNRRAEITFGN